MLSNARLTALLERRGTGLRCESLRLCICGGAPLSIKLQHRWFAQTGVELRQGYGLTEAGPVCLFNRVNLPNRRGTMGVPFPGVSVSIRAIDGSDELPDEADGEICVAGPNVFTGYVNGDSATPSAADRWAGGLPREGDWLRTGDRGVRHADGTFSFRGVLKPMFTRNGFNIYPREIERVVMALPDVRSVRVRAIPEPMRENDIGLEVEGNVSSDDVKAWCDANLAVYKRPTRIMVS